MTSTGPILRGLTFLGALALALTLGAAEGPKPPTAEEVRDVQARYQAERKAAETAGLTKKFAPEWFRRADELAKKGDAALAAGRLLEARDAFRGARWQVPGLPADFPAHIPPAFGDLR